MGHYRVINTRFAKFLIIWSSTLGSKSERKDTTFSMTSSTNLSMGKRSRIKYLKRSVAIKLGDGALVSFSFVFSPDFL